MPDEELRPSEWSVKHVPWGVRAGRPSASTGFDEASRRPGIKETVAFKYSVGIDGASDKYDICAVDNEGKVCGRKQVKHSGDGIRECIDWILKVADGDASAVAVAIEGPHGAMVESLIEIGR